MAVSGLAAALTATTAAQALATCGVFILPMLAPFALPALGVAPHWIGHQVAVIYIAAACVSSIAGGVVERFGPARGSQLAVTGTAAGAALAGLVLPGLALGSAGAGRRWAWPWWLPAQRWRWACSVAPGMASAIRACRCPVRAVGSS